MEPAARKPGAGAPPAPPPAWRWQPRGEPPQAASDRLAGLTFVLSGVFENYSREQLQTLIQQHGGKITGSISKKLSYLVAGDNMGPAKREKALGFKVPIISENELLALLPGG
ncbi:MAG: BRCT domain-containing protein [Hymenobacter sp.]